jgi:hypothetical protein
VLLLAAIVIGFAAPMIVIGIVRAARLGSA